MKLGKVEKLMARLSLKMQPSQLEEILACSILPSAKKDSIRSPISFLVTLRKRSKSVNEFLSTLQGAFEGLENVHDIAELLKKFRSSNQDLEQQDVPDDLPPGCTLHRPSLAQSSQFNKTLLRISNDLTWPHLEIMVQLSPTPDGQKEYLVTGIKLFEEMKRHGCISENDTELLDDFFRVLRLKTPTSLLTDYKQVYPPILYSDYKPTAPQYATPPSNYSSFSSSPPSGGWGSSPQQLPPTSKVYHPSDSHAPVQPLHPPPLHANPTPQSTQPITPSAKPITRSADRPVFKKPHQVSNPASGDTVDTRTAVAVKAVSPRQQNSRPSQQPFRVNRSNSNSNSFYDPTYPRGYPGPRPPSNYGDSYVYSRPSPVAQLPDKEAMISGRSAIPSAPFGTMISGRSAMPFAPSGTMISGRNATASIISSHNTIPSAPPPAMISGHNAIPTVPIHAVINATPTPQPQDLLHKLPSEERYKSIPRMSQSELSSFGAQSSGGRMSVNTTGSTLESYPGTVEFPKAQPAGESPRLESGRPGLVGNEQSHLACLSHARMSKLAGGEVFYSVNETALSSSHVTQPQQSAQSVRESTAPRGHWSSAIEESSPPGSPTVSPINCSFEHNYPHPKRPRPQNEEEGSDEEGGSTKRRRARASNVIKRVTRSAAKKERPSAKGASKSWVSRLPIVGSFFRSKVKEEDSDSEEYDTCEEDQSEDDQ